MAEYLYFKAGSKIYPVPIDDEEAIAKARELGLELAPEEEGRKRRLRAEYKDSPVAAAALGAFQVPTVGLGAGILEKTGIIEPGTTEAIAEENPITYYGTDIVGSLFGPMLLKGAAKGLKYTGEILERGGIAGGKAVSTTGDAAQKAAETYLKYAPDQALTRYGQRLQDDVARSILKGSEEASRGQSIAGTVLPLATRGVAEGGTYGATYGLNEELITNPEATAEELLASTVEGAVEGMILGPLFSLGVSGVIGGTAATAKTSVEIAKSIYGDMMERHGEKFGKALSSIFIHGGDEIRGKFQKVFNEISQGKMSLDEFTKAVADVDSSRDLMRRVLQRHNLEDAKLRAEASGLKLEVAEQQQGVKEARRRGSVAVRQYRDEKQGQIRDLQRAKVEIREQGRTEAAGYAGRRFDAEAEKLQEVGTIDRQIAELRTEIAEAEKIGAVELGGLKYLQDRAKLAKPSIKQEVRVKKGERVKSYAQSKANIDEFYNAEIDKLQQQVTDKLEEIQGVEALGQRQNNELEQRLKKELEELQNDVVDAKLSRDVEVVELNIDEQTFLEMSKRERDDYINELDKILEEGSQYRELREITAQKLVDLDRMAEYSLQKNVDSYKIQLDAIQKAQAASEQLEQQTVRKLRGAVEKEHKEFNQEFNSNWASITSTIRSMSNDLGLPILDKANIATLNYTAKDVEGSLYGRMVRDAFSDVDEKNVIASLGAIDARFDDFEEFLGELSETSAFGELYKSSFDRLIAFSQGLRSGTKVEADGAITPAANSLRAKMKDLQDLYDNLQTKRASAQAGVIKGEELLVAKKRFDTKAAEIYLAQSKVLSEFDTQFRSLPDIRDLGMSAAVEAKTDIRDALKDEGLGAVAELEGVRRSLARINKYGSKEFKNPTVENLEGPKGLKQLSTDAYNAFNGIKQLENFPRPAGAKASDYEESLRALQGKSDNLLNYVAKMDDQIELADNFRTVLDEFSHFMKYDFVSTDELFPKIEEITAIRPSTVLDGLKESLEQTYQRSRDLDELYISKKVEYEEGIEAAAEQMQLNKARRTQFKQNTKKVVANFEGFIDELKAKIKTTGEIDAETLVKFASARADAQADLKTALDGARELMRNAKISTREQQQLLSQFVRGYRNAELAAIAQLRQGIKQSKKLQRNAGRYIDALKNDELEGLVAQEVSALDALASLERRAAEEIGDRKQQLLEEVATKKAEIAEINRLKMESTNRYKQRLQSIREEALESKKAEAELIFEGDREIGQIKSQLLTDIDRMEAMTRAEVAPYLRKIDELQAELKGVNARQQQLQQTKGRELDELSKTKVDEDIRDLLAYRQRDRFGSIANAFGLEALTNAVGSLIPQPVAVGLYASFKLMDNPRDILRIAAGVYGASKWTGEFINNRADGMLKAIQGGTPEKYVTRRSVLARAIGLTSRSGFSPDDTMSDEEYDKALTKIEDQAGDEETLAQTMIKAQGKFNQVQKLRDPMDASVARAYSLINSVIPPPPEDTPFGTMEFFPTPEDKAKLRDAMFVINDPIGTFFYLAGKNKLSPQVMQMLQQVYPELSAQLMDRAIETFREQGTQAPYSVQVMFSLATQAPLTNTLNPNLVGALQANISQPPAGQEQQGGVNMTQGGVGKLSKSAATYETPGQRMMGA